MQMQNQIQMQIQKDGEHSHLETGFVLQFSTVFWNIADGGGGGHTDDDVGEQDDDLKS